MIRTELRVDVSHACGFPDRQEIAATLYVPASGSPRAVIFAGPGGGYSRHYFDLHHPGVEGYSQVEQHVKAGFAVVTYDHLGVGDSTATQLAQLSFEWMAAATDAMVREVRRRLQVDSPVRRLCAIGIGQSMGGCLTIVTQGRHRTFDAIAVLGFSAVHTVLPQRSKSPNVAAPVRSTELLALSVSELAGQIPDFAYPFHWEETPKILMDADLSGGFPMRRTAPPWGSATIPFCAATMLSPGCVAAEAAAIEVPVLLAMGERDVCPRPHDEPRAYAKCRDVELVVIPRMAHMHNFAPTRRILWERIEWFAGRAARGM
jgi:pimeloyl-ACP methyl ester carboxylesterase